MDNVRWRRRIAGLLWLVMTFSAPGVRASGGPLGIDHRLPYDDSGIWKRSTQIDLIEALIVGEVGCGLWEGGETRLGRTCWQSIASSTLAGITAQVMKSAFTRVRPHQFDDPDRCDAKRPNARRNIAFGHGEHFCPGASLARAEARISFERLLARLDDIELVDPGALTYAPTFIIRGLNDLPLRFRRRT